MTVSCPDCRSVFRVDPAKVPATGVRARCSVCGGVIAITGGTLPVSVTPSSSRAVTASFGSSPTATPATATPATAVQARGAASRPFAPTPVGIGVAAPPSVAPMAAQMPVRSPVFTPVPPTLMTPPAPARLPTDRHAGSLRPTAGSAPGATSSSGAALPAGPQTVRAASPTPVPIPYPTALPNPAPTLTSTPTSTTPAGGKRSINPFLNADPGSRARRLARALVSDLVAYNPQKRESGLRDGTLRQLFREEIKKSYEEYVEQVGRELAESSPHFQDALNEILGGGRKLF